MEDSFVFCIAFIQVNCAGIVHNGLLVRQSTDLIEEMISVNLLGTIYCCKYALKEGKMIARKSG